MDYTHQPYPSVRYARDGATRIVNDPTEHDAATAEGWADTPAAFDAHADASDQVATDAWQPPADMQEPAYRGDVTFVDAPAKPKRKR